MVIELVIEFTPIELHRGNGYGIKTCGVWNFTMSVSSFSYLDHVYVRKDLLARTVTSAPLVTIVTHTVRNVHVVWKVLWIQPCVKAPVFARYVIHVKFYIAVFEIRVISSWHRLSVRGEKTKVPRENQSYQTTVLC